MIGNLFERLRNLFCTIVSRLGGGHDEQTCDVCGQASVAGVYSSRFGPVSHSACETCRDEGAEPIFMICFHIHSAGGPDKADERFANVRSFHEGRYIGLAEILSLYPEFADEFDEG